jgi:hypothetical protein
MRRFALMFAMVAVGSVLAAGPALAFQCPKLVAQINDATGNRLDSASYDAKQKGAEAAKLHAAGKHADSVKMAQDGLKLIGMAAPAAK